MTTILRRLRSLLCVLTGGHALLQHWDTARDRVCLRCITCEYETTGWQGRGRR
jgi:hypothetical protein